MYSYKELYPYQMTVACPSLHPYLAFCLCLSSYSAVNRPSAVADGTVIGDEYDAPRLRSLPVAAATYDLDLKRRPISTIGYFLHYRTIVVHDPYDNRN